MTQSYSVTLALGIDDRDYVAFGGAMLIEDLLNRFPMQFRLPIQLVGTKSGLCVFQQFVPRNLPLAMIEVPSTTEDPYRIQLEFHKVFSRLDALSRVLCLDYDHICGDGDPAFWADLDPDSVMVSSEVSESDSWLEGETYFNASLIFGRAGLLAQLGKRWEPSYERICDKVGVRHRTEIALTLAARDSGIVLQPVLSRVQANFANPSQQYLLFHFGGDSETSRRCRDILSSGANGTLDRSMCREALRETIREKLQVLERH